MFTVLMIVYGLIIFISYFGDYKSKEIEKDKQKWKEITGNKYY